MRPGQIGSRQGMFLQRNKVQRGTSQRILLPGLPRRQKIDAQTKAGFQDDKVRPPLPTCRQAVPGNKNVSGLRRAAPR